jgi:uncharacterized phage protein (TIGR02218 family)
MKQAPQSLKDLLNNNELHIVADLWSFAFKDGSRYWSAFDTSITSGSTTWTVGPGLVRGSIRCETGLKTDTLRVTLYPDSSTVLGVPLIQAAVAGYFDDVQVTLQRAYMTTPGDASAGLVTEFVGNVAQVEPSSTQIVLTVKSFLARLNEPLPRRIVMAQCPYALGGTECGVNLNLHVDGKTAAAGSTVNVLNLNTASTYASPGSRIVIMTGTYAGTARMVRSVSGAALTLTQPLPGVPAVSDGVNVYRACDKTRATCSSSFNNLIVFGGFPDAPKGEAV